MALWTNAGLSLVATAIQSASANVAIGYVGISTGCGTISGNITAGVPLTSLPLDGTLPANLGFGQSLTITDGVNTETVTTSGAVLAGATAIPINSWTPANNYAAHVTGIAPTPAATDIALYNESTRVAINAASAGAAAGESLSAGYFDGTQGSGVYMLVGFFGDSTATTTIATGTLMAEDIQFWNHVVNADSNMYQADSIV